MKENIVDSMSESSLTPAEFITLMFERTDEDGILYIPGWHYDGPGWEHNAPGSTDENDSYRCRVDWNLAKYKNVSGRVGHCSGGDLHAGPPKASVGRSDYRS